MQEDTDAHDDLLLHLASASAAVVEGSEDDGAVAAHVGDDAVVQAAEAEWLQEVQGDNYDSGDKNGLY